jgi:peptide-methionine (S)-S-oxide reductase
MAVLETERGTTVTTEKAILAGGCFWGAQELLRKRPGVISTRVGYSGGDTPNATYRNHGDHAEAVEIIFDPDVISFRELLEFFFQIHDPSTRDRQGNDVGRSYRSAIFYTSDEQKAVAEDTIADVDASGLWPGKVVTEVEPAGDFWEAEEEHQDYLQKIPYGYTCHFVRPGWVRPRREAQPVQLSHSALRGADDHPVIRPFCCRRGLPCRACPGAESPPQCSSAPSRCW